jgi:hypothetical protein
MGESPAYENENKERMQFVAQEISLVLPFAICQVEVSTMFKYLEFLTAFQEPPTVIFVTIGFCCTLIQGHCFLV